MANIVAIVGRPNVGKSTLFNRLTESRKAIVNEESGVTRDRHYGRAEWNGQEFVVIDTGGYVGSNSDVFNEAIRKQVLLALDECSVIVFMVDVTTGITDLDEDVANVLRRTKKKIFLAANKVDTSSQQIETAEFYNLGMGEVFALSSNSGSGTGELLDAVVGGFDDVEMEDTEGLPKISVIGRPNVGKSSIINAFLNQERNIVTDISGTTRDSLFTRYKAFGHDFFLIDTAGVRRKKKVREDVEFYSVMRTLRAIENSDVCLLMIDATMGIEAQDLNLFSLMQKGNKGIVIVVNKWDLVEKDSNTINKFTEKIKEKIAPFIDVPIVFTSALSKQRILKSLEVALAVHESRTQKIITSKLNDTLLPLIDRFPPPSHRGLFIKIKYITQLPTYTPSFAFFCNHPNHVKDSYKRFLENKIRESFNLTGVPINIFMRQK
jgi:GTP-binding protein|tara:strand:+ start:3165 stop:4469 length:1305 start_codon:yes stop_codon:yes gene_type:complete